MENIAIDYKSNFPRPDYIRKNWMSLNGEWDFSFDTPAFDQKILVPYVYQSLKSGINISEYHETVWYRRQFIIETALDKTSVLLKFGAVDYEASVYVNNKYVGSHKGGYGSFEFNITEYVVTGNNEITVKVNDGLEADKPRGKQTWTGEPFRCWYTASTGIWQNVWIEYTGITYIKNIKLTPRLDQNMAECEVYISDNGKYCVSVESVFKAAARDEQVNLGKIEIPCENGYGRGIISFPEFGYRRKWYTWTPEQPNLIDVSVQLVNCCSIHDEVITYFGMRSLDCSAKQFYLNNEVRYQKLILNQGYWEDTLLTSPSAEAIKKDLEIIKSIGFNGFRMHQKIEDPILYYWADRMGLFVWGELPSSYNFRDSMIKNSINELIEFIERDYNHPSIICWVPVNESWGVINARTIPQQQNYINMMYHLIKSIDITRPVSGNDGWEQTDHTDIFAIHDYALSEKNLNKYDNMEDIINSSAGIKQLLAWNNNYNNQPVFMSEYGGISFTNDEDGWGYYNDADSEEDFLKRVEAITKMLISSGNFAGFCYTQFTDVMQEKNGLLKLDRTPKASIEKLKCIFSK